MKKPIHKHIGHRIKRTHTHFTKYLYERDTIFATIWVFLFIVILGSIPLNLGFLNPIKLGLKDFDFNDIYYSKVGKNAATPIDKNIVIINIDTFDRAEMSRLIDKTASFGPKVMGLDVLMDGPRGPEYDMPMAETISKHPNLVLAVKYFEDTATKKLVTGLNEFKDMASHTGYVNFPYNDWESVRQYYPLKMQDSTEIPSFSLSILKLYNDSAYQKLRSKGDKKLLINYTRQVTKKQYQWLDPWDILNDRVDSSLIKGKIALIAYATLNPYDVEDKKFTPMNDKIAGKSIPDMDGIVVHANIISMALEENYVKKLPLLVSLLIAVIVCWLHMSFFVRYYLEDHIWFHLVAKIAQVGSAIFFVWLGIFLFDRYRLKVDLKYSIIVIIMAVDVIYFYEAWAVWMHKKYNFRTIFHQKHHH